MPCLAIKIDVFDNGGSDDDDEEGDNYNDDVDRYTDILYLYMHLQQCKFQLWAKHVLDANLEPWIPESLCPCDLMNVKVI